MNTTLNDEGHDKVTRSRGKKRKSTAYLYDAASEICWRAGHDDPESLPEATRFDLVMRHVLGNPIVKRAEPENDK